MITVSNVHGIKKGSGANKVDTSIHKVGIDFKCMDKVKNMSRNELKEYLESNGVEFKGNAKTEVLLELAKETCR